MRELTGMDDKDYTGAKWLKVDLHLHSPGVESFKLPSGIDIGSNNECQNLIKEYIKKIEEAQIKIGAITDYNGVREKWFELIKKEASDKGIVIFPGVELSLPGGKYGLHLLLIFEQDVDIKGLNTFLLSLDENPQKSLLFDGRKHRDIDSESGLEKLISKVREKYKCLVIFPHPEDDKGHLRTFNPSQSAKYLMSVKPDAIEYISEEGKNKLISTNELPSDYFEKIAILENTDPKCLDDIGTKKRDGKLRTTYYKLSSFSIGAFKIALHDPEVRVKTYKCPSFYHNRISKILINGSTFLKSIEILFNPELNTFIGGRGVGKSAIIETMRYAMDLPIYADKSLRMDFVESVVGSGGEISLFIERYYGKEKKEFEIKRTIGKDTEIIDESGVKTGFSIQSLFEEAKYPIIIGQKELYFLSITPTFQLQLIDEFIGKKIRDIQEEFKRLIEQLRENGRRFLDFEKKIDKKETYEQRLKEIESQIKVFKDLGVEGKLRRWTNIVDDEEKLQEAIKKVDGIKGKIISFFDESAPELNYLENNLKRGESENKFILEKVAEEISHIKRAFEQSKKQLLETTDQTRKSIEVLYAEWLEKKKKVEIEIQKIKKELAERGLKPDELERLTKERAKLIPLIEELKSIGIEIKKLESDREKLKNKTGKKRHDIFNIRKEQLDKINDTLKGRLKIEVKYEEDKDNFIEDLTNILKGSRVSSDAIEVLVNAPNKVTDGLLLSQYIKGNEQKLREEFNLTQAMSSRILEWFKDSERLYELETLFPQDKIEVYLKVNEEYKLIDKLSIGQKATALLLLLFAQEDRIVVLDQPEEDLDNRFIYEDVVKILREIKGKRQLFIATHNANIPVLGDSELVLVLETKNERCVINNRGSIDKEDIRADVKNIMEGGEEAFRIRAEKYGGV